MRVFIFIVSSLVLAFVVLLGGKHTDPFEWRFMLAVPICGIPALLFMLDEAKKPTSMYDSFVTLVQGVTILIMVGTGVLSFVVLLEVAWHYVVKLF